jgi:hypothetical protein
MDFWESSNPFTRQLASNHVHEQFSLSALYRLYICSPFKQIRFMCWTQKINITNACNVITVICYFTCHIPDVGGCYRLKITGQLTKSDTAF